MYINTTLLFFKFLMCMESIQCQCKLFIIYADFLIHHVDDSFICRYMIHPLNLITKKKSGAIMDCLSSQVFFLFPHEKCTYRETRQAYLMKFV